MKKQFQFSIWNMMIAILWLSIGLSALSTMLYKETGDWPRWGRFAAMTSLISLQYIALLAAVESFVGRPHKGMTTAITVALWSGLLVLVGTLWLALQ